MKTSLIAFVMVGTLLSCAFSLHADSKDDTPNLADQYQLPKDPKTTVVSLDFKGGFTPPRIKQDPTLSILADGTVKIPANYQGQKPYEGKLNPQELQALLKFIIKDQQFFEYDEKAVQKKLAQQQQGGLQIAVADAATTIITVNADGKSKQVQRYALGMGNKVKEIEQLQAIQQRLMQISSVVQLGGAEKVAAWLKQANQQLKQQHPDVKPLAQEDLASGVERTDGSIFVNFSRSTMGPNNQPQTITNVTINQPKDGQAQVTVVHRNLP